MMMDNNKNTKLPRKVKKAFNRRLGAVCIGDFRNKLAYKSDLTGKTYIKINPKNTSRTCSSCGHIYEGLLITERHWACEKCEAENDRDVNAAQVIKAKAFEK